MSSDNFSGSTNYLKGLDYSILQQCIHCGLCLPTCPTYDATLKETSSPRGRIALMRAIADDQLKATQGFAYEMYFCLGCLACQTVCPADVKYEDLIERARAEVQRVQGKETGNFLRSLCLNYLFTSRTRIRGLGRLLWLYQKSGLRFLLQKSGFFKLLGRRMSKLEKMLPTISDRFLSYGVFPAFGNKRFRVGLLAGCVQDIAFAQINQDTLYVLQMNGCEVVVPKTQQCCGSLHGHNGEIQTARRLARLNLDAFPLESLDAVIVNSGGCGSFMKHYHTLLADDPVYRSRAKQWSKLVKDISEFLVSIDYRKPKFECRKKIRVTYHDSCHLCHGQGIRKQPREIVGSIPGVQLVELREADWCCGSAGIYNITHPDLALKLLDRKMKNISETRSSVVASANPGCSIQLQFGAEETNQPLIIVHPVELLAQAYREEENVKRIS